LYNIKFERGKASISLGELEFNDGFTAIASHVTSYARIHLLNLLMLSNFEGVLYTDTDSLFVDERFIEKYREYIDKYKLGYLKVEGYEEKVTINGLKDYVFGEETKIKGISKNAEQLSKNTFKVTRFRR